MTISGVAQQDYKVTAEKSGYYQTIGPWRGIETETGLRRFGIGLQKIDLELRPIRNPVRGIAKFVERTQLPAFGSSVGFDLEIGDWVSPHGKGKTADFVFKLEGAFHDRNNYDQTFSLTFSNPADGIILTKFEPREGPAFKFPYEAPSTGYQSQRIWRLRWSPDEGSRGTTRDLGGETNYIFRVRTSLDREGNVQRALYGVIGGDIIPVAGNIEIGRYVSFLYRLNPSWTRNIEFAPEQGVRAGTGELLVQPPSK